MAVVEDGGWLPEKESTRTDAESSTSRFERWAQHRQLLLVLMFVTAFVVMLAIISGAIIYMQYMPHQLKPKISHKTCEKMYCSFGAQCLVDFSTQQAYCRCQETCSTIFAPVCGTDGVTYSSDCQLRVASCTQQRRININHQGHCDTEDPCEVKECPFGAKCRPSVDGRSAECVCPDKCATYGDSRGSRPVCGTDGRDYPNVCELQRTSCKEMRDIRIKFQGRCDPCEDVECPTAQVCQLDDSRNPICRCNAVCSPDLRPVCGSDGRTYTNECTLRVEACRSRKSIRIIYTGECSTGANPCESLECGPGEECDIDRYGIATCQCQHSCEPVMRPVCGSDGRTYHNECELQKTGCLSKRDINLVYRGECGERGPCYQYECSFGSVCVIKSGYPVCECPSCTEEFEPLCGTNSISYTNLCKLKREACEQKSHIDVSYEGLCNGCEHKRCEFYAVCESDDKNEARCICPHSCIKVESSVCGTDGITYLNECEMRVAACNKQQNVVVGSRGPCDLCQNVNCKYGARCENGQCVCPTDCPMDHYEAVCASDGTSHYNECEMRRAACIHSRELSVMFYGECQDVGSSGQEMGSSGEGCQEKVCNFGSTCDYDADALPICVCNFDCPLERDPVCGSDGVIHANRCRLKEETCHRQMQLYILPISMCENYKDDPCEGETPLVDPITGLDYFCGEGVDSKRCPPISYCHKTHTFAKCCREVALIKTCADSNYGCCPDDKTSALGPNFAGCPSVCNCYRLGSYGLTCDAETNQCSCKPGVGGLRCDRCEPGYWGLHKATEASSGCSSCNCNQYGSVRDDCEQMTGRCVCRQGIKGMKCDTCILPNTVLGSEGCTDASIARAISGSCSDLECLHGAICREKLQEGETSLTNAQCVCDFQCSSTAYSKADEAVCGTDGNTYGSECQLRLFACRYQKPIEVTEEGPCKRGGGGGNLLQLSPTPGPIRRSTVQRTPVILEYLETKSTRDVFVSPPETYQLTTRPTQSTPTTAGPSVEIPSFYGQSYLELPRLQAYTRLSLELEFKPFSKDGILLYNGQTDTGAGDFISLALKDSFVEFRYNLGSGPVILRSPEKLHMGKFHRLVAKRYLREGLLTLEGQRDVSGRSQGILKSLNLAENLYVGYVPSERKGIFENVAVHTGIIGCIRRLKIGKKEIDLRYPGSKDVISGNGIRECGSNPCSNPVCRNDGICQPNKDNTFKCTCLSEFTGPFCEKFKNPCLSNPCAEGSTCQMGKDDVDFTCKCKKGQTGNLCDSEVDELEDVFVPDFTGKSYLEIPTLTNVRHGFDIEIWLLSRAREGVVLYNGQKREDSKGDFLAITIEDGHVYLKFDLGSKQPLVSSQEKIELDRWFAVKACRLLKTGTLQIDNKTVTSGESMASLTELNLNDNLYIGGIPSGMHSNHEAGLPRGLDGAIQRLVVNGEVWDDPLALATWSHGIRRYRGPPCGGPAKESEMSEKCLNRGICIPHLNRATCKCHLHYWGPKCENRLTEEDMEKAVSFNGQTFLSFPSKLLSTAEGQKESNIEITFRTNVSRGLILWLHGGSNLKDGDYLALALSNGKVQLSFDLGKQRDRPLLITSALRVDDNQWHTAIVERTMRFGSLAVDDNPPITDTSRPGATELNTDGIVWIGGYSNLPTGLPVSYYDGFIGCIERVVLDGDPMPLVTHNGIDHLSLCDDS